MSDAVNFYTVVNVADNTTTIHAGPAVLVGVYINTALSAQALPIEDNTTPVVSIPASAAAGAQYNFPDILFRTSLIVDPDDAATGSITVAWRPYT